MPTVYSPDQRAHLTLDNQGKVRHILHSEEYFESEQPSARLAAEDYLRRKAEVFEIPPAQLQRLHVKATFLDPREQEIEYREYEVKKFFTSATYCYYQTIHNVPVWHGGMTVTVKENPFRITHSDHYGHDDLKVGLPAEEALKQTRALLLLINSQAERGSAQPDKDAERAEVPLRAVFDALGGGALGPRSEARAWINQAYTTHGQFFIYRFDAKDRGPKKGLDFLNPKKREPVSESEPVELALALPPLPRRLRHGEHYLVAEIIFHLQARPHFYWKVLIEVETGAVLWLRSLTALVDGLVFTYDPQTSTGDLTMTHDDGNAILNPLRDDVVLPNLGAPAGGEQALTGTRVTVIDDDLPTIAPPHQHVQPDGSIPDFDYDARTDDFAAVNAYYHSNNIFDVIESLGFTITGAGAYFDGTAFPVHVDHRARFGTVDGIEMNAFCGSDAGGDGIGLVGFCLSDLTDTANPLGRAVDKWVHWHEIGGHGTLDDHVGSGMFGFSHSAGDSLAAFQNDPESLLRGGVERFHYAPFRGLDRWFNREVAAGWGWGGANDFGNADYNAEQILATTLFRMYRSLGGDSADVAKRWQASRVATYLVLNAIGHCSVGDNPASAEAFYNKLILADADDWTTEGYAGGAYNKVIRWTFEKQGLWRAPGAATTEIGAPPAVDLYIDDGRHGEYDYQAVHWENPSVWNRAAADGIESMDPGVAGVPSFAYVKVKNRGTTDASGTVKLYHCRPGAGLTWPTDFEQAEPLAGLPTGNVQANNGNEVKIGPFDWTPNVNTYGHDCLLAIVTTTQDTSNIDKLTAGETIQEWRLVPHDNNVGQRNVPLVPGEGGEAAGAGFESAVFFAGNNFNRTVDMHVRMHAPKLLAAKGWRLELIDLPEKKFRLKPGEKRAIRVKLAAGAPFTADEARDLADRSFAVHLYGNDMLLGGMTYQVDPDLKAGAGPGPGGQPAPCADAAQKLSDCLKISGGRKVKKVRVKKVVVEIVFDEDCDCG